jgi:hypothetical protein
MGSPRTGEIYEGALRDPGDVPLTREQAARLNTLDTPERIKELNEMKAQLTQAQGPRGLRTLDDALYYLDYHAPDEVARKCHEVTNRAFQTLMRELWAVLPDGPGKTVAIRAIGTARMECNSAIANKGQ